MGGCCRCIESGQGRLIVDADEVERAGDERGVVLCAAGAGIAAIIEGDGDAAGRCRAGDSRVVAGAGEADLLGQRLDGGISRVG